MEGGSKTSVLGRRKSFVVTVRRDGSIIARTTLRALTEHDAKLQAARQLPELSPLDKSVSIAIEDDGGRVVA
jgi:hypothetical protein